MIFELFTVCYSVTNNPNNSRQASTAASEPGSEVSSMMGSGDNGFSTTGPLAEDLVVQGNNGVRSKMVDAHESLANTVAATPLSRAATELTPSTIQPIVVQLSVQDTPSAAGPQLISIPSAAPTAGPLISISLVVPTATQLGAPTANQLAAPTATQLAAPTARQLAAPNATQLAAHTGNAACCTHCSAACGNAVPCTHCYASLAYYVSRPNQMGYFAGAPSDFYPQSNQFPYMANPSWEASQREQLLQTSSFKNDSSLRLGRLVIRVGRYNRYIGILRFCE